MRINTWIIEICLLLLLIVGVVSGAFLNTTLEWRGYITEITTDDRGLTSYVVNMDGREKRFLIGENTGVIARVDGIAEEDFLAGQVDRAYVTLFYDVFGKRGVRTDGDGRTIRGIVPSTLMLDGCPTGEVKTLADGSQAQAWAFYDFATYPRDGFYQDGAPVTP